MARPGYLAEDTAARNALAQEADLARRAAQSRVSPSQALSVVNKIPTAAPANTARPPIQLPATPGTGMVPSTPARPILRLPSGNIPSAVNRINAPAPPQAGAASATLNAINGKGAFLTNNGPLPGAQPKYPGGYPEPGRAFMPATPGYNDQVSSAIAQQAKQRASIAASGATAPTGAPVLSPQTAPTPQAPGVASRALSAAKTAGATTAGYASKALQGAARVAPVIAAGAEAASAYNDVTTDGMTGIDQAARVVEGSGRVAAATAGGLLGASFGGPAAPITGLIGGALGYMAPDMVNEASNRIFGTDTQLSSQKAAQLRDGYKGSGLPHSPAELASGAFPDEAAREIPTITGGVPANVVQLAQTQRAQPVAGPASVALSNAQAPKPQAPATAQTRDPTRYAEISGYTGPKKNVNRRYSLEDLEKLGERNVIPAESFRNPGAGIALSEVSGGRESFALGANPITQYQREKGAAQAQNQATNDRATALINGRPDENTQRLMTGAERALNAGQKRKAAGFTDLIQATKPSDALNRQRQPSPELTPQEQQLGALKLQQEGSSAEILQIQAAQAQRVAQLQEALLTAPPEQQAAISAQLDKVMGRQTPQRKPDPGAITDLKRYENLGRLAAAELNPEKKAALIEQQKALEEPPPVPGAKRGNDGNWYIVQNGQMMMVSP